MFPFILYTHTIIRSLANGTSCYFFYSRYTNLTARFFKLAAVVVSRRQQAVEFGDNCPFSPQIFPPSCGCVVGYETKILPAMIVCILNTSRLRTSGVQWELEWKLRICAMCANMVEDYCDIYVFCYTCPLRPVDDLRNFRTLLSVSSP